MRISDVFVCFGKLGVQLRTGSVPYKAAKSECTKLNKPGQVTPWRNWLDAKKDDSNLGNDQSEVSCRD